MKNLTSFSALCLTALALGVAAPAAQADYQLQRKSQFQQKLVSRNVFWPIGYVHEEQQITPQTKAAPRRTGPKLSSTSFVVSSILIGGGLPLAVINGRDRAVGDALQVDGVTVEVAAIRDGSVMLRYEGSLIEAPLKR